jgi:hypothetical protein
MAAVLPCCPGCLLAVKAFVVRIDEPTRAICKAKNKHQRLMKNEVEIETYRRIDSRGMAFKAADAFLSSFLRFATLERVNLRFPPMRPARSKRAEPFQDAMC